MSVTKEVRRITTQYDAKCAILKKGFLEELKVLQDQCKHTNSTRWEYELDSYGEIASTADGVLIRSRECLDCGRHETKVDDTNDYDSEIPFL